MTDYFIKNGGDDNADGLSDGTAWETRNKALAHANVSSGGDRYKFNGGDIFDLAATVYSNSANNAANPVVFESYGAGKAIWNVPSGVTRVLWFRGSGSGVTVDNIRMTKLYGGYAASGLDTEKTFSDITYTNCIMDNLQYGALPACPNIIIANCRIINIGAQGILSIEGTSNLLIENNYFMNCGYERASLDHSIYIGGKNPSNPSIGITVRGNTIYNNNNGHVQTNGAVTIVVHGFNDNVIIEDNHLIEAFGSSGAGGYGIAVDNGDGIGDAFNNVIIRNNMLDGVGFFGIHTNSCLGLQIYNNSIVSTGTTSATARLIGIKCSVSGDTGSPSSTGIEVYNNVVYCRDGIHEDQAAVEILPELDPEVLREENNIFTLYTAPLNFQPVKLPVNGALTAVSDAGGFTYVNQLGLPDSFTYMIKDSVGHSNTATVSLPAT